MKAYLMGGHYCLHIEERTEFPLLLNSHLVANLQDDAGADLGKKIVLKYDPKARDPSVDYKPPKSSWDGLKEINVTITDEQFARLEVMAFDIFRFGSAFSVDLYLEKNISDLI